VETGLQRERVWRWNFSTDHRHTVIKIKKSMSNQIKSNIF